MQIFRHSAGFTLLEVLMAVSITAMIGVGAVQLLDTVARARDATTSRSDQLAALQRFNSLVGRDMEQFLNRPIRDQYGDERASLILDDPDYMLEFTRNGWRDRPGAEQLRSSLQRIAYQLRPIDSQECEPALKRLQAAGVNEPEYDCLVRYRWAVLDRADDSTPQAVPILDQVISLKISLLVKASSTDSDATESEWQTSWPPEMVNESAVLTPTLIRWQIELPWLGEMERLWLLAHDGDSE